jgi:hypothetical protein
MLYETSSESLKRGYWSQLRFDEQRPWLRHARSALDAIAAVDESGPRSGWREDMTTAEEIAKKVADIRRRNADDEPIARLIERLAGELAQSQANERRNEMGLEAATRALNTAEGIRVALEKQLAARDADVGAEAR